MRTANAIAALLADGVGVLPTDTIYGLVGSALSKKAVDRIYRLRKRDLKKPIIILMASVRDVELFGIRLDRHARGLLSKWWPGKVSVVLPMGKNKKMRKQFAYLHRGTNSLAFRQPKPAWLKKFLERAGPLVAPSANREGKPAAATIREAKKYFGQKVDFYFDRGVLKSKPSTLVKISGRKIIVLRPGAVHIPEPRNLR